MRRVISARAGAAASIQRRSRMRPGGEPARLASWKVTERPSLRARSRVLVGIYDALNQGVAHDVPRGERAELDSPDVGEYAARLDQSAGMAPGQVDLRDVSRHHRLGTKSHPGEEHL